MLIHIPQTTDEFLDLISQLNQSWARVVDGFAFVGDDFGNVVSMSVDKLEKDKYYWSKGKVYKK